MEIIKSRQNLNVKYIKSLSLKKNRDDEKKFLVEGKNLLKEAIKAHLLIETLVYSEKAFSFDGLNQLLIQTREKIQVSDDIVDYLSETEHSQGIIAVVNFLSEGTISTFEDETKNRFFLLDGISDPGNLGTIFRVALAANFGGIYMLNCVDIYNPKAVRASAGTFLHLPFKILNNLDEISNLKGQGAVIVSSSSKAEKHYKFLSEITKQPLIIALGSEAHGVSEGVAMLSDYEIKIPINPLVESLNVASCASILAFS